MTEKQLRHLAGHTRTYGMDITGDEPSHIHLPRRWRIRQRDDLDAGSTHGESDCHKHGQATTANG